MRFVSTPLGNVDLRLDGHPCANDGMWEVVDPSDYAHLHPVDGNWRIAYWHEPDGNAHTLECRLNPAVECEGGSASGERLEATEINDGKTALVIAVEYDFEDYAHGHGQHEYDYTATASGYMATVELPADAKAQWIVFGVSWLEGFDAENRTNPWLVGDPGGDRLRLPTGVYEKDGTGPYGGKTIEWFLPIEHPWERKGVILAFFAGCEIVERTNADEDYENLEDIESIIEVVGPDSASDLWVGFGGEYTLGFGGTHWHYEAYEGDYGQFKHDIKAVLSGDLRVIHSCAGSGRWQGTEVVEGELTSETDGWALLRSMKLGPEYEGHYEELGGTVEIVSWLPERRITLRIEPRG